MAGSTSRRYPSELRDRAVRMVAEIRDQHDSEWAAISEVARLLGVGSAETVRKWFRQAQVDGGVRSGVSTEESAKLAPATGDPLDPVPDRQSGRRPWCAPTSAAALAATRGGASAAPPSTLPPGNPAAAGEPTSSSTRTTTRACGGHPRRTRRSRPEPRRWPHPTRTASRAHAWPTRRTCAGQS